MRTIRIGTRKSRLACIQAEMAAEYINHYCRGCDTQLVQLVTTGDRLVTTPLDQIGTKGVFVRELDAALRDGVTDLSVHSLKDMPSDIDADLPIIGYSLREDARDVLVLPVGVKEYDCRLPIGCSSSRRSLQLRELYPKAAVKTVRGNVPTRLEKLDRGEYGALVLAAAGLIRLGLKHRISRYFSVDEMIPAAGQGIICVQGRAGEDYGFLDGFFDREAGLCAMAERAFMGYLNGGCSLPVGVYADICGDGRMRVRGLYCDGSSGVYKKKCITGDMNRPRELGISLARALKEEINGKP